MNNNLFEYHTWQPLIYFGFHHDFFTLHRDTLIYTWIGLGCILILSVCGRLALQYPHSKIGYLTFSFIRSFIKAVQQSFGYINTRYYFFITALFTFILICNLLLLIPGCEEPTKDLNTTLALSLISFFYVQKESFRALGGWRYLQEYMKFPFSFISSPC